MGNINPAGRSSHDLDNGSLQSYPMGFHSIHSDNIQLSPDRRSARRVESFCKGISFGGRTVAVNEKVYVCFSVVSTSWSGVVRFGFTSKDPDTLDAKDLPRYACPDLTNKPGFWAKALPERYAKQSTVLFFYYTRSGDVMFGIDGEEKGVFFSGVNSASPLWVLLDIYGNSTALEFIDGVRGPMNQLLGGDHSLDSNIDDDYKNPVKNKGIIPVRNHTSRPQLTNSFNNVTQSTCGTISIRHHAQTTFVPMSFHTMSGRNICLSSDKTIAMRIVEEYCNGYVFTQRPLLVGEKIVIQILSIDSSFHGSLAFGLTAADPSTLNPDHLPDNSDLLLDRLEYWVVNKDVCLNAETGDELSFHLTEEGEVRYGHNGHHVSTLMYVDKTLPMWAFFDIYGKTQKIKSLGLVSRGNSSLTMQRQNSANLQSNLTVALPPPRAQSISPTACDSNASPPPRPPPPPRSSPSLRRNSSSSTPPSLPPKQHRPLQAQPPPPGTILIPTPAGQTSPYNSSNTQSGTSRNVDSVLLPMQVNLNSLMQQNATNANISKCIDVAPPIPNRIPHNVSTSSLPCQASVAEEKKSDSKRNSYSASEGGNEIDDNASNECSVCFENAVDSVIYTCGHMCMCYECAIAVKEKQNQCPICRQEIKDVIKAYRNT